jgi:hypothetical protein
VGNQVKRIINPFRAPNMFRLNFCPNYSNVLLENAIIIGRLYFCIR